MDKMAHQWRANRFTSLHTAYAIKQIPDESADGVYRRDCANDGGATALAITAKRQEIGAEHANVRHVRNARA